MTQPVYNAKTDTWDYGTAEKAAQQRLEQTRKELRGMLSGSTPFHEDPNATRKPEMKEGHGRESQEEAFERWLARECPSGDAASVQYQWTQSTDYAEWEEANTPVCWVAVGYGDVYRRDPSLPADRCMIKTKLSNGTFMSHWVPSTQTWSDAELSSISFEKVYEGDPRLKEWGL